MQSNDTPFPSAGDNFRTVAHVQTDLELALVVLELGFPVLDDDCTYEELAEDYAVVMAEFQRQLDAGEQCTGTVPHDDGTAGINQSGEGSAILSAAK